MIAEKQNINYGFMLEESQLKDLANNIPAIWSKFILEIKKNF